MDEGLAAIGLHRRFRRRVVVHGLSLVVRPGEIVGLLGPNGAGKTTAFRMLTGLLSPHEGRVELDGRDVTRWPLWRRARAGLGYLPQQVTLFRRLTVAENVDVALRRSPLDAVARRHRRDALLEAHALSHLAAARGGTLSGGERRRAEIVRALAAAPRVLLVDEPFAGLDPVARERVAGQLRALAMAGVGVLLCDHDARQSLVTCDRVYILASGVLLAEGAPLAVATDARVRATYLGEGQVMAGAGPACTKEGNLVERDDDGA